MDQRHTATGGLAYVHARSGVRAGVVLEYGSGTPIGHGGAHEHAGGGDDHAHGDSGGTLERVPSHLTADLSLGIDLLRDGGRPRLTIQVDVENVGDDVYRIAQESQFSPTQFSVPRLISATARFRF